MNVYIFLILVIVIAVLFISKKDKIKEGMGSVYNKGYLLDWGGKKYMNDCNEYTTSVGPYKSNRGNWLVGPCQTGYNDAMNGNANNNSCHTTYKSEILQWITGNEQLVTMVFI